VRPESVPASPADAVPFLYGEAVLRPGQRNFSVAETEPTAARTGESTPPLIDAQRDAQMREMGRQKGLAEARATFEAQLAGERAAVVNALAEFSRERAQYYRKIEREAVQLAMAIARKVIHRETQVDPLLLRGVVRAALDQMEGATSVVVKVHPQTAADWRQHLGSRLGPENRTEIVEDASVPREGCILKTAMGTTELGLDLQLQEIEKGLTDLLAARPE
jgi:flagellar assembly protein FliH